MYLLTKQLTKTPMRRKNRIRTEPFTDLLFNTLLGFTFLFFITILFINPISKIGNVNMKAEYIVTVDWKDSLPDDVDIWVQDTNGETVSYLKKDAGWLHLDRDDQGIVNDIVTIDGEDIIYPINREVVTLRGIIPGEYILNLYLYEHKSNHPIDVKVIIEKVNPTLKLVYANNIRLEKKDTEVTVTRFFLDSKGDYSSGDNQKKILTPYNLKGF